MMDDGGKDWSGASKPKNCTVAGHHQKSPPLKPSEGRWSHPRLRFGLLAFRTGTEPVPIALGHQFAVVCHSSPSKLMRCVYPAWPGLASTRKDPRVA